MKKRVFLTIGLMFIAFMAILAVQPQQPQDSTVVGVLTGFGLSKSLAWIIVSVVGLILGKVWPQKWTDPLEYIRRIVDAIAIVLQWINEKTNNLSKKQKEEIRTKSLKPNYKEMFKSRVLKLIMVGVLLSGIGLSASSQSLWTGFFKPVPNDLLTKGISKAEGDIYKSTEFLLRPAMGLAATGVRISDVEGELFTTAPLLKTGPGISLAHYVDKDGVPFNNYTVNGMLLIPLMEEEPAALAIGVSAFNLNVGLGLDLIKSTPFKHMIFGFFGAQYTF